MGVPPSSVNCLEGPFPLLTGDIRVPSPAAGMMTTTFMAGDKYTSPRRPVQTARLPLIALEYFDSERQVLLGIFPDGLHKLTRLDQHLVGVVIERRILKELAGRALPSLEAGA